MARTDSMDQGLVSTMTDEECAAINDDDDEVAANAAGEDDGGDDDADDDAPADPAIEPAAAPPAAAPDAAAASAADPAPEPAAEPAPAPAAVARDDEPFRLDIKLPDDFQERVDALKAAKAELRERRKAGDIDDEDYDSEIDKLAEQQSELDQIKSQVAMAERINAQAQERIKARDEAAANRFLDAAKGEGVDYNDPERFGFLQVSLNTVRRDPALAGRPFIDLLKEADVRARKAYAALHGGPAPAAAPAAPAAPPTPAQAKAAAVAARKPDLSAAPASLAQVPGGDGPGDVGGEFDYILDLDGTAYEDAIAELARNPTKWARFQAQMQ